MAKAAWNDVTVGNPNAGMAYALQGARLQREVTDPFKRLLAERQEIGKANAESQSKANTADIIEQIRAGKTPERTGFYDGGAIADAKYGYEQDQQALEFKRAAEARAEAGLALRRAAAKRAAATAGSVKAAAGQRQSFADAMANGLKTERRATVADVDPRGELDRGVPDNEFVFKNRTDDIFKSDYYNNMVAKANDPLYNEKGAIAASGLDANKVFADMNNQSFMDQRVADIQAERGKYGKEAVPPVFAENHPPTKEGFGVNKKNELEKSYIETQLMMDDNLATNKLVPTSYERLQEASIPEPEQPDLSEGWYRKNDMIAALDNRKNRVINANKQAQYPEWGAPTVGTLAAIESDVDGWGTHADIQNPNASIPHQIERLDKLYKNVVAGADPKAIAGITKDYVSNKKALQKKLSNIAKIKEETNKEEKVAKKEEDEIDDLTKILVAKQNGTVPALSNIKTKAGMTAAISATDKMTTGSNKKDKKTVYKASAKQKEEFGPQELQQFKRATRAFAKAGLGDKSESFAQFLSAGAFSGSGLGWILPVDAADNKSELKSKAVQFLRESGVSKAEIKKMVQELERIN